MSASLALTTGLVSYAEYGSPGGLPVFFFHGWPASQCQATLIDASARDAGLRLISMDRPGIGGSSRQAGRRLLDWPPLLAEFADRLGIASFAVLGVSGGGPYALASAWALPRRVLAATVVCGAPPLAEIDGTRDLLPMYRRLLGIYRVWPALIRLLFNVARPFALAPPPRWLTARLVRAFPPADAALLNDPAIGAQCLRNFQGAFANSGDGVFDDAIIYPSPWGFALEEITVPVRLWHGREDRNFSWRLAADFARRLPRCEARFLDGEGHYSLPIGRSPEILRDLRDTIVPPNIAAG